MKTKNALRTEFLMRAFSSISQLIYERRRELEEQNEIDKSKYEVVEIEVEMRSEKLFNIYTKIYDYFEEGYLPFIDLFFKHIDFVENIEDIKSVTINKNHSLYKTKLGKDFDKTSYARLSDISLVDHIEDIIDLLIEDYEQNKRTSEMKWFSLAEMQHLLLLSLVHDVGKITPLMESMHINFSNKNHEERSSVFMQVLLESCEYSNELKRQLKRLYDNLNRIAEGKVNSTVERFIQYDSRARVLELDRLRA